MQKQDRYFLDANKYPEVKLKKFLFTIFLLGMIRPIYDQVLDLNACMVLLSGSVAFIEHHFEFILQSNLIKKLSEMKYEDEFT